MDTKNNTILITGGTSGFDYQFAEKLLKQSRFNSRDRIAIVRDDGNEKDPSLRKPQCLPFLLEAISFQNNKLKNK